MLNYYDQVLNDTARLHRPGGAGPVAQALAGPIFAYVVIIIKYNTPEREINSLIDRAELLRAKRVIT